MRSAPSQRCAIARRFGDTDLEFDALALLGECYVATGRVAEGMRLLDEVMAAATGGEVTSHGAIGEICCRLLSACEHATDVRRAEQWMELIQRSVAWTDFVVPTCRSHYGGILVALGRWEEAETELRDAIETFKRGYRGDSSLPLMRLADLRVRQGRYEEAERLIEGADWHPAARRATATIALARGDLALAEELAQLCMEGADPADPGCAPALALLIEIQLGRDEPSAAERTLGRLKTLAANAGDELVTALLQLSQGRVAAAAGDERAIADLRRAFEAMSALNLPLEAGRARLELARAMGRSIDGRGRGGGAARTSRLRAPRRGARRGRGGGAAARAGRGWTGAAWAARPADAARDARCSACSHPAFRTPTSPTGS